MYVEVDDDRPLYAPDTNNDDQGSKYLRTSSLSKRNNEDVNKSTYQ